MWRTGTTVVLAPRGATPGVSVRGGGPGTRETDALAPGNLVDAIHAVCLTGGSAYGLAAADGVMTWLEEQQLGVSVSAPHAPDPSWVVPVVPAAVIFDLGRGGGFDRRPTAEFGYRAARTASGGTVERGAVGAGTGAVAGGLQGGVGTASMTVQIELAAIGPPSSGEAGRDGDDAADGVAPATILELTVGALAVVNASGAVVDRRTGLPFEHDSLRRPNKDERRALLAALDAASGAPPLNTTIGVVATSAVLTKAEATKLADVAHDGLARAVRPSHSLFDGDTVFGLATGDTPLPDAMGSLGDARTRAGIVSRLLDAAAICFARACTDATVEATDQGGPAAYRDLCPSVVRER